MTPLRTGRLVLRNWEERDRDLFHRINSDERVMRFFPMRRDRAAADAMMDRLSAGIAARGFGFAAAEFAATGECIGFVGLHATHLPGVMPEGTIEVGWRLAPEYWGKGYASEGARAWLDYGFDVLKVDEIVSFAVQNNHASTAVMRRIGMTADPGRDFDSPDIPDTHPHLKRHVFYRITREAWRQTRKVAG